ncbi:hypothetical protein PILCRDRAFT_1173 [Piloderma croceum F 1598]|uniref:Importin N-terminal domain-containing protein n=1 Tax=Piloderma croceum (strain F 1598) TaxID=765440 RepID=A0A0C3GJW2_PILCF|nr:hypothetical protein PILCRDRAFT_1173 [Piloderma croceum F 1598]
MNAPRMGPVVQNVNPEELLNVISAAASQDPVQVRASSDRLKQMFEMFGTFDGLSDIASQKALPLAVRQQSIIQFKNAALGHWRSRKFLSDEARTRIRARCMTFLDEVDDTIAECNEFIIARIARTDFPTNWPSLLTDLTLVIDTNLKARYSSPTIDPHVTLMLRRSIKVLDEILKEITSKKMLLGVKTMANMVDYLHQSLYNYYEELSSIFTSTLNPTTVGLPRTADDLLLAHLVYKCLVKIATWVWNRMDKQGKEEFHRLQPWLQNLFQTSALRLQTLSELRINIIKAIRASNPAPDSTTRHSIDQLSRHVRLLGKFFRRLQQLNVSRFVEQPMCSDIVLYYWSKVVEATNAPSGMISDSNEAVYPVRFLVQAMVLFKESLAQWTPTPKKGVPNSNILSQQFVEDAVKLLVTRFIPLNPADLENWMSGPEEWVNFEDKENEQWEYELRPCGERVLMTLCHQYNDYVVPLLETTFKQLVGQPTVDLSSVIQKEALYCAIGRCASRLKDVIPFNEWLEHSLVPEARETNPNFPIIKRRIAWLMGQWIGNDCSPANNPRVWDVLVHLLQDRGPGTDAVVRLTAAVALRECVDSVGFDANVFAPYIAPAVTDLVRIIGDADTMESKRRIAASLNAVIERAEIRIVPLIPTISSALPQYWSSAGDDYLFKGILLSLITVLVGACREHSSMLGSIVVPLLHESMSPGCITHLDEDALLLWQTAVRNTVTVESVNGAPALIDLFPLLMSLLRVNLDLLGKIIGIMESYFLLGAQLILQTSAVDVFCAIFEPLANSNTASINVKDLIIALNLLLQLAPASQWGEAMHNSGLFAHVINKVLESKASVLEITEFMHFLARIAIADQNLFQNLMSATATPQKTEEDMYEELLEVWFARVDNMSEPRHRKLTAMAFASLISTGRPKVIGQLFEILNVWQDVSREIDEALEQSAIEGSNSPLRRFWDQDEPPSSYYHETEGTPEYDRRRALFERDPVRTTQMMPYVAARYEEAKVVCGGEEAFKKQYLMALTQVEARKAAKGHRPLPVNLDVLGEIESYLYPQLGHSNHR